MLNIAFDGLLHRFTDHVGQFVGILDHSWYSHWSLPISVVEALPISQQPEGLLLQLSWVVDQLVVGWGGCSGINILSHHLERVTLLDHFVRHDRTGLRVRHLRGISGVLQKESVTYTLLDQNLSEGRVIILSHRLEDVDYLLRFDLDDCIDLAFSDSVAVEDDGIRQEPIPGPVEQKCLPHVPWYVMSEFLTLTQDDGCWPILCECWVHGGNETCYTPPSNHGLVVHIQTNQDGSLSDAWWQLDLPKRTSKFHIDLLCYL